MQWMEGQGFFAEQGFSLVPGNIHFASSRSEKLSRISDLACEVFIDDLEEVLTDPDFPRGVNRVLFGASGSLPNLAICSSWRRVAETVFDD